jgi:heme exporter protein C
LWNSLHQEASVLTRNSDVEMDGLMLFSLFFGVIVFTMMYVWLVLHRQRVLTLDDLLDDTGLDRAIEERRREVVGTTSTT